jgi:hypothetical protein
MKLGVPSISAALLAWVGNGARTDSPSRSADPAKARITVLYDAFSQDSAMQKDWGYAPFVEYGGKRILFDGNAADDAVLAQLPPARSLRFVSFEVDPRLPRNRA